MPEIRSATASSGYGRWYVQAIYRGAAVELVSSYCAVLGCSHEIVPMHHTRGERHYCPTGFIWCWKCGAVGEEPEPYACTRWESPWWERIIEYLKVLYR